MEDCTPCLYEHSYMMQNPVLDIDDVVSFQCRRCPEHSTQDESLYTTQTLIGVAMISLEPILTIPCRVYATPDSYLKRV